MRLSEIVLPVLLIAGIPAFAAADGLVAGGTARVIDIVDGDTLVLEDGRKVRLVGIQAPKLPLGRPYVAIQPLADDARAALAELTLDARSGFRSGPGASTATTAGSPIFTTRTDVGSRAISCAAASRGSTASATTGRWSPTC